MRRLLLFVLLLSSLRAFAATPIVVTGTMQNPGNVGIQGNSYVMFRLQNFAGFVPRVQGTAIIADTELKCAAPSCLQSNGHFSIPVWSNSDIVPNTCGQSGIATCTYYTIEFYVNGKLKTSGNYCILNTNPTFDLNSNAPCRVPPLPPAPDTSGGGGGGGQTITLKTNGTANPNQTILNLTQGSNITITPASDGTVTVASTASGGVGDALLHPPTAQTFQSNAPTVPMHFDCPVGSANGFTCFDFRDNDGSNLFSIRSGGTFIFRDGITGHWLAQYFGNSTGTIAGSGLLRAANTDVMLGWRNNAGTGDVTLSKDNTDTVNWAGVAHMKTGSNFYLNAPSMTAGRPVVATGSDTARSSQAVVYADDPSFDNGSGDDCLILFNAMTAATALGQDVDARGLTGNKACITNPIPDSYSGKLFLGPAIWWLRSNAASWTLHSRLDIIGIGSGRTASGPTSGTIFQLCNEANGSAKHSSACGGTTFDPAASNLCIDGAGTTFSCPIMGWSNRADHFAPLSQFFDTKVEFVTFAGNLVSGAVGVKNGLNVKADIAHNPGTCPAACGAQENSGINRVRFEDFNTGAAIAIDFELGSRNSAIRDINILNNGPASADCSATLGMLITAVSTGNGPKSIENVTHTNTTCAIDPVTSLQLDAGEVLVDGYHCEQISGQCADIGKNQDVKGFNLRNVNGIDPAGQVVHIESGHSVGGKLETILNINSNGYTVRDDIHTVNGIATKIRVQGPEGENLLSDYGFDFGTTGVDDVHSSSPLVAKSFSTSANWTSNVNLTQWDAVKIVTGSDVTLTKAATSETDAVEGFSRTEVTDPASNVSVTKFGIITGPVMDSSPNGCSSDATNHCCPRDYVFPSTSTAGHVQCSTVPPFNVQTLGRALVNTAAGSALAMEVEIRSPRQYVATCTGTGANPLNCGTTFTNSKSVGTVACPHSSSAATCTINSAFVQANSVIIITRSTQLGAACETVATETAATTNAQIASIVAGTSFTVNVPTLPTALSQFCFNYQIINP